jgi:signal transduction histidine kinase/nitrogen fixation-related uncharacterized protein
MTIKKRLAISNVLMILVPIAITLFIAVGCIGILWYYIARGTGLGFEDSENFYQASSGLSGLISDALKSSKREEQIESLKMLSSFLDRGAMSLFVTADGENFYLYGEVAGSAMRAQLETAAAAIGNEGTISSGTTNLHVHRMLHDGVDYVIYLYNTQSELSYTSLKVATAIEVSVLILTILASVFFTDRFLTRFVFKRIAEPLDLLAHGVQQISDGNLDYRLEYDGADEFQPVCEDFNDMARRLKESVERSRHEEESRKELMAGISHDLRSPLTSIQAYVEGLLDGVAATPEARRKYLVTIKVKAEELERMVARILAYSKLEMEDTPRDVAPLRLDEYLATEISELSADYSARGLDIFAQLEPCTVAADVSELRQILINIADNSLKYKSMERGTLHVNLQDRGETCTLAFSDDGPGVPPESLSKLFDVFYRADLSRNDRAKGSGLGLAIVEKTVRRMGGDIHAENAEGGGLSIVMELPKGDELHAEDTDH